MRPKARRNVIGDIGKGVSRAGLQVAQGQVFDVVPVTVGGEIGSEIVRPTMEENIPAVSADHR